MITVIQYNHTALKVAGIFHLYKATAQMSRPIFMRDTSIEATCPKDVPFEVSFKEKFHQGIYSPEIPLFWPTGTHFLQMTAKDQWTNIIYTKNDAARDRRH
jgi:hypothetical protein